MSLRWLAIRPRHEATSAWVEVPLRAPRSSGTTGMGAETRPGPGSFTGSVAPHRIAASTACPGRRPEYERTRAIFMATGVASRHEARFRLRATEREFSVRASAPGAYHQVEGSLPGRGGIGTRSVPPRAAGVPHRRIAVPIPLFPGVDALIHVSLAHGRRGDIARIDTDRDSMDCPPMSADTVSLSGTQLSLLVRVRDVADGRTERRPAPE